MRRGSRRGPWRARSCRRRPRPRGAAAGRARGPGRRRSSATGRRCSRGRGSPRSGPRSSACRRAGRIGRSWLGLYTEAPRVGAMRRSGTVSLATSMDRTSDRDGALDRVATGQCERPRRRSRGPRRRARDCAGDLGRRRASRGAAGRRRPGRCRACRRSSDSLSTTTSRPVAAGRPSSAAAHGDERGDARGVGGAAAARPRRRRRARATEPAVVARDRATVASAVPNAQPVLDDRWQRVPVARLGAIAPSPTTARFRDRHRDVALTDPSTLLSCRRHPSGASSRGHRAGSGIAGSGSGSRRAELGHGLLRGRARR